MIDDEVSIATVSTSRRTIVKTGAKLAYVTPALAASFKLASMNAGAAPVSAIEGGTCSGDFDCGEVPQACGTNEFGTCYCFGNTERQGVCGSNENCGALSTCTTTADCAAGSRCAINTCCGVPVCIEDCPESAVSGQAVGDAVSGTPSGH